MSSSLSIQENIAAIISDPALAYPQRRLIPLNGDSIRTATHVAVTEPLDYPPMTQAIYDGDCVVIAVQAATQFMVEVLETIVQVINADRAEPISIAILADGFTARQLDLSLIPNVSLITHDPAAAQQLALLAVGANDQPLHVNRLLFDADIVIPIGCIRPLQNPKTDDCIFPGFGSEVNREEFREQTERDQASDISRVNDQLGTFFAIQLIVGPGDSVQDVLAGDRISVLHKAKRQLAKTWVIDIENPVDLVVATIESRAGDQDWEDFGRALVTADKCSAVSAPIVICSQLSQKPPKETRIAMLKSIHEPTHGSTSLNSQLAAIMASHPVFLASNLRQSDVEDLGLGFLAGIKELKRLTAKCSRGLLLRDAHNCSVELVAETI